MNFRNVFIGLALIAGGCRGQQAEPPPPTPPAPRSEPASAPTSQPASAPTPPTDATGLTPGTEAQLAALERAKAALAEGRDKAALDEFRVAMEGPVSGARVSAGLAAAQLLTARGDATAASAIYRDLVIAAPRVPEVFVAAGRHAFEQGQHDQAILHLQRAVDLQPDLLPAHYLLGMVQAQAGRSADAARTLTTYELKLEKITRHVTDLSLAAGDRLAAMEVLSTLSDDRATTALVKALHDPEPALRAAAGDMLAEDDAPEALAGLAEAALAEQDPQVRLSLGEALARARARAHEQAVAPLPALPTPSSVAPASTNATSSPTH